MNKLSVKLLWTICFITHLAISCSENIQQSIKLSKQKQEMLNTLPHQLVIAHRGTTYWAPEETEAAMRWARNSGAHYLEFDLQRTKDGYLVAMHDNTLERTTDILKVFPSRLNQPVSSFTYLEILSLETGSWFNRTHPERARSGFIGLDILSLEDIIQIAEGNRIIRDSSRRRVLEIFPNGKIGSLYEKDPADNGNRPGIYPETKVPSLFPGIEVDLRTELERLGWYSSKNENLKTIDIQEGKINIANTNERVILQTFSKESLVKLKEAFPKPINTCFLLWRGNEHGDISTDSLSTFEEWVQFGINNGATIIGPSISGTPNNYTDLLTDAHYKIIEKTGAHIHAYSFDTKEQLVKYKPKVNGVFSNKTEEALLFYYPDISPLNMEEVWLNLGYAK